MTGRRRTALYACYFATGAFGLTYEVVWSRYLALLVGNTAYAHTAVLATFMGGLALGAALFGPLADRVRDGVAAYGWMEVAIGLFAALFPAWFGACSSLADTMYAWFEPGSAGLSAAKLTLAVLCVLPPAVLMGGTLPMLTRALTRGVDGVRVSVAALYATNAAGAVIGCVVTGFWGLGAMGLPGTITLVGTLNTLLGIAVVGFARWRKLENEPAEPASDEAGARWSLAIGVAAFSGFATMALEVAWIRCGVLLLGSSTYAFTLMLAAFISGIAGGAYLVASPLAARWRLRPALAWALLATALSLVVFLGLYPRLPYLTGRLLRAFAKTPEAFPLYQLAVYGVCFVAMLVPAAVAGVVLPVAVRLTTEAGRIGARLGHVYAANTIGTLLGASLTGLVLFGWIGVEGVFRGALVAYALVAAVVAWGAGRPRLALVAVLVAGVHPLASSTSDPRLFNDGTYRRHRPLVGGFANFQAVVARNELLYFADGPHASVTTARFGEDVVLRVNGKPDASTGADMSTQMLLGHLPMLFHPAPKDVFVVGLGSGVTAGAVLAHDGTRLTVAEISEEVVAAQRSFEAHNGRPLANPRTTLVVDDARTVMRASEATYDVVISEPTNPWQAGVAGLFTVEFYDLVKSRLNPGGVFTQWMHAYETNDALMSLVVATLLDRFAHVTVFEIGPSDFAFVASDQPLPFTPATFAARVASVHDHLKRIDAERPFVLLATQVKSAASLRAHFPTKPVNSDDYPILELEAPVAFFGYQSSMALYKVDDRLHRRGRLFVDDWLAAHPLDAGDVDGMARFSRRLVSDIFRRGGLRLARAHLPADHPARQQFRIEAGAVALGPWPPPNLDDPAWLRLASQFYDTKFVRWAPIDVAPLEAAAARLGGTHAKPLRRALVDAACRHETREVCARVRGD